MSAIKVALSWVLNLRMILGAMAFADGIFAWGIMEFYHHLHLFIFHLLFFHSLKHVFCVNQRCFLFTTLEHLRESIITSQIRGTKNLRPKDHLAPERFTHVALVPMIEPAALGVGRLGLSSKFMSIVPRFQGLDLQVRPLSSSSSSYSY